MNATRLLIAGLCAFVCQAAAASGVMPQGDPGAELRAFFDDYIAVYNRRFGQPQQGEQFRVEIGSLVQMPVLQSPPKGAPFAPESAAALGANFERFVTMLEARGVTRLEWLQVDVHPLTDNKALANNVGRGVNAQGETVYETVSLYLLHRDDDQGWRIAVFSPYDVSKTLQIGSQP